MKTAAGMTEPYKLCFLGYQQLTEIARRVVADVPFADCEIDVLDCIPEDVPEVVGNVSTKGYEVYIAGGANAVSFSRNLQLHLQEVAVRDIDYLAALKKAGRMGTRIAVAWHRYSREIDLALLRELSEIPAEILAYEDSSELFDHIRDSDYEVIIGASQACSYAERLGRKSVLVYAGEETVRRSISRARYLAIELRKEQRHNALNQALVRNVPAGIIVTNEDGRITLINHRAGEYLNMPGHYTRGRILEDLFPNLSPKAFLKKNQAHAESYKILHEVRYRCQQSRLVCRGQDIGVLTILRVDNTLKSGKAVIGNPANAARWKELVAVSDSMKRAVSAGKKYASSPLPLALIGDVSLHRQLFAESVHTGGPRADKPLLVLNLPQISPSDAGRHLLGSVDPIAPHVGLIQMAAGGTIILKNVQDACPAVQDILLEVLTHGRITPVGGYDPILADVRFITIFDRPLPADRIRRDLLDRLCTLTIDLPDLADRPEDLPILFQEALDDRQERELDITKYKRALDLLCFYSWPGNTSELNAAAGRFAAMLNDNAKITPHTVHRMMVRAIGEDALYEELTLRHPCLKDSGHDTQQLQETIEDLKYYLGYNNLAIAERLGMSRSTLWRAMKESE